MTSLAEPKSAPEAEGESTARLSAAPSDGISQRPTNKRVVAIAEGGDADTLSASNVERGVSRDDSEARFGLGGNGPPRRMTFNSSERRLGR